MFFFVEKRISSSRAFPTVQVRKTTHQAKLGQPQLRELYHRKKYPGFRQGQLASLSDFIHPNGPWTRAFFADQRTIVAVLLRPITWLKHARQDLGTQCSLEARGLFLRGKVILVHGTGESHEKLWDTLVVHCHFSSLIEPRTALRNGGKVVFHLTGSRVSASLVSLQRLSGPFHLTVCVPPVHGENLNFDWWFEWLEYSRKRVGIEHFFIYSARHIWKLRPHFYEPEFQQIMTFLDMSSQRRYRAHYFSQLTAIYDCLFLNRQLRTKWTLFHDIDEVLHLPRRWSSGFHFLQNQEGFAAVTFKARNVDTSKCKASAPGSRAYMERMRKWEILPNRKFHPKYALRPQIVSRAQVHLPIARKNGIDLNLHLDYRMGYIKHFRGILNASNPICVSEIL